MKRKVLDVQKLIDDLYIKSGEAYDFGYAYVGDDYEYGFIHCVNYLDVTMEDYDGYDDFGDEDNYCYYCTDSKENEQSETISITESEIIFLYDLMRNTNLRDNKELFKKIKHVKDRINNKDLSDAFNSNGWGIWRRIKI